MSVEGLTEVPPRDAPPMGRGAEEAADEIRRRKEAERERDAATSRATEAARRAALARRDASEQRARAEAAEAELARVAHERDAVLRSASWKITRPLRTADQRLRAGLKGVLRSSPTLARWAARLRPATRRQGPSR